MTDEEIVERAQEAEKMTCFGELVHSPISKGVNSAYGIGFIEGMVEYRNSLQEEPVSDDLGKAADQDVCEVVNECSATGIPNDHIPSWVQDAMINEFIHGAKWREEQFEKERLKQCDELTKEQAQIESDFVTNFIKKNNCTPTFIDAIEYGMKLKLKEENKL